MYKTIQELRQEEIDELKQKLIIDRDDFYNGHQSMFEKQEAIPSLTEEEWAIIDNADCEDDIPSELIYKIYWDTTFVDDDFWCNT